MAAARHGDRPALLALLFHLKPDLPELLAGANVEGYLRYFFESWTYDRRAFDAEAIAEYVSAFSQPGALR